MARALAAVSKPDDLTIVVNVGDDDEMYGLHVSPDLDTVTYTLAGIEGPYGWGRRDDTFEVMQGLSEFGIDTSFRLGDRDLAHCLQRTTMLRHGGTLSEFVGEAAAALGIEARILPATDDPVRTKIRIDDDLWLDFQEYFVARRHEDRVRELRFEGAADAVPAPGVLAAIAEADAVIITPSNPPLSIWPLLAVPGMSEAVAAKQVVAAVSPLFGGKALKGPAATVMQAAATRIARAAAGTRFAAEMLAILQAAVRSAPVR
jgi:LPPG:FO 2-phospho-L-lactate transferase